MTWSKRFFLIVLYCAIVILSGCSTPQLLQNDLSVIYKDAAKQSDLERNPVIVIPGILGSKLYDTQSKREIWGIFNNEYVNPHDRSSTQSISLPLVSAGGRRFMGDSIISTGALDRVKFKLFGVPVAAKAYAGILKNLGVGGYRDESLGRSGAIDYGSDHFTCFQFHYDWRRSNAHNAAMLDAFIKKKRVEVRAKLKEKFGIDKKNIKFDIVAHSMGGLVSRYYMRYGKQPLPGDGSLPKLTWSGAKNIEKVILVGTPNNGSIIALEEIINGKNFAPKWLKLISGTNLPNYPAAIIGSFPSIYELLPRTRHRTLVDNKGNAVNLYDVNLWEKHGWGLLGDDSQKHLTWMLPYVSDSAERRKIAKSYLKKSLNNAEQFHRALDRKVNNLPRHVKISLIVGDAISTKERVKLNSLDGSIEDNHYTAGDGVVLRSSVLGDERSGRKYQSKLRSYIPYDNIIFLPYNHLNLTKSTAFSDQVLHRLLEE